MDYRERYKRIAQSDSFKRTHEGMSVGEVEEEFDYRKCPYNKRERAMLKHKRKWNELINTKQKIA